MLISSEPVGYSSCILCSAFSLFLYTLASEGFLFVLFVCFVFFDFTSLSGVIVYVPKVTLVFLLCLASALLPLSGTFPFVLSALRSASYRLSVLVAYNWFGDFVLYLALPVSYTSVPLVSLSLPFPFSSSGPCLGE